MTTNEIIKKYTSGDMTADEANAALKEAGANFHFVPGQNTLTKEEAKSAVGGPRPSDANGFGIMDDGVAPQKVEVKHGILQGGAVNQVNDDGSTTMTVYVTIGGYRWEVYGNELGYPAAEKEPWWVPYHTFTDAVAWQAELDKYIPDEDMMFNRPKYHGVEVVKGAIRYIYAEDGTAKYQPKSMRDYDKDHGRV